MTKTLMVRRSKVKWLADCGRRHPEVGGFMLELEMEVRRSQYWTRRLGR